jgi:serine/threonine protein phosphatase PrpC
MENQDFVLIDEKNKDYRLYSILDGHGKYGKLIAETAANKLSSKYLIVQKNIYKENP